MADIKRDLTRTTLAVLFIGALIATSFLVIRPFLPAIIWGSMIVVATWPVMLQLQARLWNRRPLAVTIMTIAMLLVLLLPLSLAISSIVENADQIAGWTRSLASFQMPPPPDWLGQVPLVGAAAVTAWQHLASTEIAAVAAKAAPYAGNATKWLIAQAGGVGSMLVHFLVTIIVAAILYARGENAAAALRRFSHRLAGERGEQSVLLAGQAIRGVALGVIVTALVQAAIGGIGLAIAGIPFATLLTAVMFMLCIAQLGPVFVLLPAIIWMYWNGEAGWATFLVIWSVPVCTLDNFLRPILIQRGADLPLLLICVGVIGGLLALGLVGIFVGPVVLSVTYSMLLAWMAEDPAPARPAIS
jgi:predicted PurR-regulated permease PerM